MNQESQRLRETILVWQDKVGIKFDIEEFDQDFTEPKYEGMEEFD